MTRPPRYLSFLLRLWQTQDRGHTIWRASVESPGSGERHGFADMDELIAFLQQQVTSRENGTAHRSPGESALGESALSQDK